MATHHVSLRRGCPALSGVDRIAGRVVPQSEPDSSAAHPVQNTLLLLPVGTFYHGTAKHHSSIGEVQSAYLSILAPQRGNGGVGSIFTACWRPGFHPHS
jgi:hypothetical protein